MAKKTLPSYLPKADAIDRVWYVVDASDKTLGHLATSIATVLMGKHKPTYAPHMDTGDFVVVTNAHKVRVSGNKAKERTYQRYSYHPGGRRVIPYATMMADHPERILTFAVKRMLPKSTLGRNMLDKLKVYAAPEHPHQAQSPQPFKW